MTGFWICIGIMAIGALGFLHGLKLWSIVLIGFNMMFATFFTVGVLEMLANILDGAAGLMAYYSEMDIFLLLYIIVFLILMFITRKITKNNLFFEAKTETISKWIACFVVILGFSGVTCYVFYATMPQKPRELNNMATMKVFDMISKGSLKPLLGSDTFDTNAFVQGQIKRNAGVYIQTVEKDTWKFDGDSPNAR